MTSQLPLKRTSLILFGDSLPLAQAGGVSDQFTPKILRLLPVYPGLGVYNLGIRGDTFGKLLPRIRAEFPPRVRDGEIVVVWCGINDSAYDTTNADALITSSIDFGHYVRLCLDAIPRSVPVFVLGLHHVNEKYTKTTPFGWRYANESIDRCNKILEGAATAATRHNTIFVPTVDLIGQGNLRPDGIHLQPSGYREVAGALVHEMRDVLHKICSS